MPITWLPLAPNSSAADHLIYLTDVAGVLDGENVISAISCEEIERLVQARVVSGGMILKLEAAKRALEGGVREVHIVGGDSAAAVLDPALFAEVFQQSSFLRFSWNAGLRGFIFRGILASQAWLI